MNTTTVDTPIATFIREKYREYLSKTAVIDRDLKELLALESKLMDLLYSGTENSLSVAEAEFIQKQICDVREEAQCLYAKRSSLTKSYMLWLC
jgi:hypothetical protein